ncbi:acyl-CoA dehydrogenase [Massilia niastensis]|uniref:acyl-CoA dehydrogenase n=1 Tax=Massilia niastensis TaxID=544911 RepID=UPI0004762918|nr:acyl-CoA dehydrogenase [Massilia niastensis]
MIYESTNEIQAIDLLFRKVVSDSGHGLTSVLDRMAAESGPSLSPAARRVSSAIDGWRELAHLIAAADEGSVQRLYAVAGDFLRVTALTLMAWAWARVDALGDSRFADGSDAFSRWVHLELAMQRAMVQAAQQVPAPD